MKVSYSGNITIQLADHLFQFVLLEGFFHDAQTKNHNIKERNFKHFNEREFLEAIHNINIDDVLCLDYKDQNISIENINIDDVLCLDYKDQNISIENINIDDVLCLDYKDPNISIENFYNNINYILDEFAPFWKLNKNDIIND